MAAWCLPRNLSNAFLGAIRSGALDPEKLIDLTSEERRAAFAKYVGDENAREVNAQFESKLLLKSYQKGLVTWANKIAGLTDPVRRDILATISKLDRVLNPEEEKSFLADLAAKKLGVSVTAEEAREIYELSQAAELAKQAIAADPENAEARVAYGRAYLAMIDHIESLKPHGKTVGDKLLNVLSISKPALTSVLHLSAMGVQGWGMISTKVAWDGFARMFGYFMREESYNDLRAWIISHPDYELAKDGKLGLTELGDKLTAREESIQSTILEDMNAWLSEKTGVPNAIRASSRAFTGYLNYVRFARFTDLLNAARLAGEDVRPGSRTLRDLADAVNDFTGRANLGEGDKYASAGPLLNSVFFAPRKLVATVQMFNPWTYADPRVGKTARMARMRQLTGSLAATAAVLWLAKSVGADVNFDPRSADFGKILIKTGPDGEPEKLEITGGNATWARLLARLATGESISGMGKTTELGESSGPGRLTRADLAVSFLRGKLAPMAGLIADALYGKNPAGQPFSITDEMRERLMPITMNSWLDFAANNPSDTAAYLPAMLAVFGIGLESPAPPVSVTGLDAWGDPMEGRGTPGSWRSDPVNVEMRRLGMTPRPAPDKIRGVKLTEDQEHQYVETSGKLAHMRLSQLVGSPGWEQLPATVRQKTIQNTINAARRAASTEIMIQSMGSANDIVAKATAAKQAATMATAP